MLTFLLIAFAVALVALLSVIRRQRRIIKTLRAGPRINLKGVFHLILKNNQPAFPYSFDAGAVVTDEEGEQITDPAVLESLVKEVTSTDEGVVKAVTDAPEDTSKGMIEVGHSGTSTLVGKIWKNQETKDAGGDPLTVVSEVFTITTGDPAAVNEAEFNFTVEPI